MASGADLRRMALALAGTSEAPHFERAAFKVTRIYVTLAADGRTANFKFSPDEQEFKCMLAPAPLRRCRIARAGTAGLQCRAHNTEHGHRPDSVGAIDVSE